jgi:hypothetical protein
MLPIHMALWLLTGSAEMSVLKMLLAGKREQLVPGTGSASTAAEEAALTTPASKSADPKLPASRLT